VPQRFARRVGLLSTLVTLGVACGSDSANLEQHQQKLRSLRSTVVTVADAWLSGATSTTFSTAALERAFELLAKERDAIATNPVQRADARVDSLVRDAEQLERTMAAIAADLQAHDSAGVRRQLAELDNRQSTP